jgi:hypothetical protein
MASFLSNFLTGIGGGGYIKDYRHASNLFTSDNFRLAPKPKFLYQCVFTIRKNGIPDDVYTGFDQNDLGFMVKDIELPKIGFDVEEFNQYNRKHFNVNSVSYAPVTITLHDDSANNVRNFLAKYYTYYTSDGMAGTPGTPLGSTVDSAGSIAKSPQIRHSRRNEEGLNWGYDEFTRSAPWGLDSLYTQTGIHLLNDISIYSLSQGNASQYTLINPVIQDIQHSSHNSSEGSGLMDHTITVNYEAIHYDQKTVNEVPTFGEGFYDNEKSLLSGAGGGTDSIFGPGGILDTGGNIFDNLRQGNLFGTAIGAYQLKEQLKRNNERDLLKTEVRESIYPAIERSVAKNFPTATRRTTTGDGN